MTKEEIEALGDRELIEAVLKIFSDKELIEILKTNAKTFSNWRYMKMPRNIRTSLEIICHYEIELRDCNDNLSALIKANKLLNK
ncbi:MAG: hypothetical protein JXQ76_07520 [Campylobacterales bacterium]|nr:hypothetical protein [Campylobacterales bacterium]